MSLAKTSIIWFRRDLRINDHPALLAAIESTEQVIPLFILDKKQIDEAGEKLLAYMGQSLRALDESLGNRLHIIEGDQVEVLKELIAAHGVEEVHISAEYERYGAERDAEIPDDYTGHRPSNGVGGTRQGVKCLHAHYAWFLAGGDDPVGRWVHEQLAIDHE